MTRTARRRRRITRLLNRLVHRTAPIMLAAALVTAAIAGVAAAHDAFPDVPANYDSGPNPHHDNVTWAANEGLFLGDTEGRFRPGASIRRDQAATVFHRYHDKHGCDGEWQPHTVAIVDDADGRDTLDVLLCVPEAATETPSPTPTPTATATPGGGDGRD